jgi:hypothetical protein
MDQARLPRDTTYEWPICETPGGDVDLRQFPAKDERVHDLVAFADLDEGRYEMLNPEIKLGVSVEFPHDLFEYVWYWQAFGGFEGAPYFGRNYTASLEPCTSIPNAGLEEAIENGTANSLAPDEAVTATLELRTFEPGN